MQHKEIGAGHLHVLHNWKVVDYSALSGLVVGVGDIDKLALLETGEYYRLSSVSPVTWAAVGSSELPIASEVVLGGIKVGSGLAIDGEGVLSTTGSDYGDMLKSVYDTTHNGIVDAAESAPWSGITDKPSVYPPDAHNHDDLYFTEAETAALVNGIIDDSIPQTVKAYSSSKVQELHDAQATAIANLSGASASFYNTTSVVVPESPAAMVDLTWTTSQASTNSGVFELGVNEVLFTQDGKYNFLNTLTFHRLNNGSPITVTFELYDTDTAAVLATYNQPLDMTAGTKEIIPMNALLNITGASVGDPIRMKVRMGATSANGTLELFSFSSILTAQALASVVETDPVFTAWDKSTGISITKSQVSDFPINITTQGNKFNGANQLVQLGPLGKLPAIDGSQLTGVSTVSDLNGLNDVTITTPSTGQTLHYDGENWINTSGGTMLTKAQPANASDATTLNLFYRDENIIRDTLIDYKPFTSDTNTFCNFSASSKYATINIYNGFNDDTSGWITSGGQSNEWIAIQFNTGPVTINSYQIMPWSVDNFPYRSPKDWYFQGSNDNVNWDTIDIITNYTTYTINTYTTEFIISAPASYSYYRLYILANVGNVPYSGISNIKLNGYTPLGKVIKCVDNLGTVSDVMGEALPHTHIIAHDSLSGLGDDDHTQYHNDTRGDARYLKLAGGVMTGAITGLKETSVAMGANNIDLATGNLFTKTITGNTTLTVSNVPTSGIVQSFILELTNGGAYIITWFSGMKWAGGIAPTLTVSGVDILSFYSYDGGTTWKGIVMSKDSK